MDSTDSLIHHKSSTTASTNSTENDCLLKTCKANKKSSSLEKKVLSARNSIRQQIRDVKEISRAIDVEERSNTVGSGIVSTQDMKKVMIRCIS